MHAFRGVLVAILVTMASGCKAFDQASGQVADSLAPPDPVTGARTLNTASEQAEVQEASRRVAEILDAARRERVPVDEDTELVSKLRPMIARLAPVSHRPDLPWEVHVIGTKDVNAFTIGGGKMFFFSGVRELAPTDDELAAVVAHEMAHNTCRHITESQSLQLAGAFSKSIRRDSASAYYAAAYSTQHEDEADRVSLLYLALAGYDPGVVPGIWARAHRNGGSNPGNFTYDHSLNADRAAKTAAMVPVARKAFAGEGVTNPEFQRLRVESPIIDRHEASTGFVALLETVANTMGTHAETAAEARAREDAARRSGQRPAAGGTGPRKAAVPVPAAPPEGDLAKAMRLHQANRLAEAEAAYERVLARDQDSVPAIYNLACICAVQGRDKRALNLLDRAVNAGFRDAAHMRADPDLASLRGTQRFRDIAKRAASR